MSTSISSSAAVDGLVQAGFSYKNEGSNAPYRFFEYVRQTPGFLQRMVVYTLEPGANTDLLCYAVLRTKCSPMQKMSTVYDVEHLLCRGPGSVPTLLELADAHLEQFATAGGASFFRRTTDATPHQDTRHAQEVLSV